MAYYTTNSWKNALHSTTTCTDTPRWHLAKSRDGCLFTVFH